MTPPRASALPPEERRASIISAAAPLLVQDPARFTTRAVAEAAGLAEGTIFRHFATKADLIAAVSEHVLDPAAGCARLRATDGPTLDSRVAQVLDVLIAGISDASRLFTALVSTGTDVRHQAREHRWSHQARMALIDEAICDALAPFADRFVLPLPTVAFHLRSLAFASTHPMGLPEEQRLSRDAIARVFLYGVALPEES